MDIDLENGGGGGGNNEVHDAAVVSSSPDPADPLAKEKQPFTWLSSAPYMVAMLAGVVLFAVGVALGGPSCWAGANDENKLASNTRGGCNVLGFVLAQVGIVLAAFAAIVASIELNCECCAPRLDQADD